jgi:hypothetical protein
MVFRGVTIAFGKRTGRGMSRAAALVAATIGVLLVRGRHAGFHLRDGVTYLYAIDLK